MLLRIGCCKGHVVGGDIIVVYQVLDNPKYFIQHFSTLLQKLVYISECDRFVTVQLCKCGWCGKEIEKEPMEEKIENKVFINNKRLAKTFIKGNNTIISSIELDDNKLYIQLSNVVISQLD